MSNGMDGPAIDQGLSKGTKVLEAEVRPFNAQTTNETIDEKKQGWLNQRSHSDLITNDYSV